MHKISCSFSEGRFILTGSNIFLHSTHTPPTVVNTAFLHTQTLVDQINRWKCPPINTILSLRYQTACLISENINDSNSFCCLCELALCSTSGNVSITNIFCQNLFVSVCWLNFKQYHQDLQPDTSVKPSTCFTKI